MADWYSVATPEQTDRLLAAWADAPIENEELCGLILGIARDQVIAYAPATAPVPVDPSRKVVAAIIRNSGAGFEFIDDGVHVPVGVTAVRTDAAGNIIVDFDFVATHVNTFTVTPDETMTLNRITVGASVGLDKVTLIPYQTVIVDGQLQSRKVPPEELIYPFSNFWLHGLFDGIDNADQPLPGDVPDRYVYAQLRQAENLWNAGRVNSSGDVGVEQFSFTPRPLDKTIRGIIRPTDGKPHVL